MDVRLLRGEVLAGGCGLVLLVSLFFLTWFGVDVPAGTEPVKGFDAFRAFDVADIVLLVVALTAIALPVASLTQSHTDLPVALCSFVILFGFIATVIVLFRLAIPPDLSGDRFALDVPPYNIGFETTRGIGALVGLLASIGIVAGGWLAMRDEGTSS